MCGYILSAACPQMQCVSFAELRGPRMTEQSILKVQNKFGQK